MMNVLALFYISMTSAKLAGTMSGKDEDGQGIAVDKGILHIEDCAFLERHRVLADLYNHTGLEVSFHQVKTWKSMSHRVFSFFY